MGQTTKRRGRRYTEAQRRAQRVLYAGPNKAMAEVLGVSPSRACHLRTDEVSSALRDTIRGVDLHAVYRARAGGAS